MLEALRQEVCEANSELPRLGFAIRTEATRLLRLETKR